MNLKHNLLIAIQITVSFLLVGEIRAKSTYAITQHSVTGDGPFVKAYEIDGDEIEYMGVVDESAFGNGPVGITVSDAWDLAFITYETSSKIVVIYGKTLEKICDVETGVTNLAGIVADNSNEKLYVIRRTSGELYVYTWDAVNDTLVLEHPNDQNYPDREYYPLENTSNAYGIALDETAGLLYVTSSSKTVRYYDTTNWEYQGSIDIKNNRAAVGIAIDEEYGFMYTGGYKTATHTYLVKTDISDPNSIYNIEEDVEEGVIGLAVDQDTGLIYCTTYHDDVRVYDPNLVLKDTETNTETGPAGIAVGSQYKPPSEYLTFYKTDDFEDAQATCVNPTDPNNNEVTYEIFYGNPVTNSNDPNYLGTLTDVWIVDYLPDEINKLPTEVTASNYGSYNFLSNTVTWYIGTLQPGDANSVSVTVTVLESADPSGTLTNIVEIETERFFERYTLETDVCCWGGDIIYVAEDAKGYKNGTSWYDAYTDLQSALARAGRDCGSEIWIKAGTYKPTDDTSDTDTSFNLVKDVSVYGGFEGDEPSTFDLDDRNFLRNKTYLSGDLDGEGSNSDYVVVDANDLILDGVIISGGQEAGIYCQGDIILHNCLVTDNIGNGITITNDDFPFISRCIIRENGVGIDVLDGNPEIINSWIHHNEDEGVIVSSNGLELRNCTIVYNGDTGVWSDASPTIVNNILWGNNQDSSQLYGCSATYSCVYDANSPSSSNPDSVTKNINADPLFAYSDPNLYDFHLSTNSPCIDRGLTSLVGDNEIDIDGNDRTVDDVDMGAHEYSCSDIANDVDLNVDGIVDFYEYSLVAKAWGSHDPNDPNFDDSIHDPTNWDEQCDFDSDYDVDIDDLAYVATEWLWMPCYNQPESPVALPMGASAMMTTVEPESTTTQEQTVDPETLLEWIDMVWMDTDASDTISEDDWMDFRETIEQMVDAMKFKKPKKVK